MSVAYPSIRFIIIFSISRIDMTATNSTTEEKVRVLEDALNFIAHAVTRYNTTLRDILSNITDIVRGVDKSLAQDVEIDFFLALMYPTDILANALPKIIRLAGFEPKGQWACLEYREQPCLYVFADSDSEYIIQYDWAAQEFRILRAEKER